MKPGKLQKSKQRWQDQIYVGRSTTVHKRLFYAHTLFMNYVTKIFVLFSCSDRSKRPL